MHNPFNHTIRSSSLFVSLHGHFHGNCFKWMVSNNMQVLICEIVDGFGSFRIVSNEKLWEGSRRSFQLFLERLDVVQVDVGVTQRVNKITRLASRDVSHQVGKQGVAGNIERNSEAHVGRPLVHMAANLVAVGINVELAQQMAGRQCHLVQRRRIPGAQENSAVFWIVLDLVDALGKLVNTLPGVVGVHVLVFRSKMAPLEPIDGSKVTFLPVA
mmetsp:Transcript_9146/g.19000  ORF Transcript_9146/g.19000 Transcript_9146/m.19000 type:complete len:214 (+) Transcript_9146:89-730(+)